MAIEVTSVTKYVTPLILSIYELVMFSVTISFLVLSLDSTYDLKLLCNSSLLKSLSDSTPEGASFPLKSISYVTFCFGMISR